MELKTNKTIKNFTLLTLCAVALLQPVLTGAMEKDEAVALINKFDKEIDDRLFAAAKAGDLKGVQDAIKDGADVKVKDNDWTPLHWAGFNNNLEMVKCLVEKGADVNATITAGPWKGETPLYWACSKDNLEMVKYLVEKGADVNATITAGLWEGETPLYWACSKDNLEMVKYLVEKGADINATITAGLWEGETPLHRACFNNNSEMVKYLVEQGADVNAKAYAGATPRDKAMDLQVKAYLEMAEDFYKVNSKTMAFDAFTQKHLENYDSTVQERNRADTHNLLHLGSKAFFDAFVGFAEQRKQLNFANGAEKEFMLLDCATRKGPHRDAWFKECFTLLNREYSFEKKSTFEEVLEKALNKLPATEREERDALTKEKNKIVQQKHGWLAIPKHLRMPTVGKASFGKVGGFGDKVKEKLIDVTCKFK